MFLLSFALGSTPILSRQSLASMGYTIAAYPLTLLGGAIRAYEELLDDIDRDEGGIQRKAIGFERVKRSVGFQEMDDLERRYPLQE